MAPACPLWLFGVLSGAGLCEQGRVAVRFFALGLSVALEGLAQLAGDTATRVLAEKWPYFAVGHIVAVHSALFINDCLRRSRQGYSTNYSRRCFLCGIRKCSNCSMPVRHMKGWFCCAPKFEALSINAPIPSRICTISSY